VKSLLLALTAVALFAVPPASAACRWCGTQYRCRLGTTRLTIGTQAAGEATCTGSLPIRPFHGPEGLPGKSAAARRFFEIALQNFGTDPSLCRKIGNETYCY
jgi:hypothetical protein